MSDWFRHLLAPPIFDDEERTRTARIINSFAWIVIGILMSIILLRILVWRERATFSLAILASIILVLLGVQQITKRGYVLTASVFLVATTWILLTYQVWESDGLRDVTINAYIIILLLASLLLGWRTSLFVGVMSIITIWTFAFMESSGLHSLHVDGPINYARDLTAVFLVIGAFIYLLIDGWTSTLQASKVELKERLRAEGKLQQQADYLTALHETAVGLLNRTELNPLLETILARACELLETRDGLIEIVLPDNSALRQEYGQGVFTRYNGHLTYKGKGVTGYVWNTGESLVVNDYQKWGNALPEYVSGGFYAVMGIPLKLEDKVIGVLAIAYTQADRSFTELQESLMERFATLAALAIHNARLNEQTQKEIKDRIMVEQDLRSSEERFRKVFNNNNIAISIVTLDEGIFLEANNAFWQLSGLSPQTALGHSVMEFELWKNPKERAIFVQELVEKGSLQDIEVNFAIENHPNKISLAYYELINIKEQPCVLSMFYDITTQRQTEIALRESESRMSAILSAIPDMIFEINRDGILTGFIASTEIQPLMPPEDFLGHNIKDLFPVTISLQTMFAIERALSSNQLHAFEYGMPAGEETRFFEARVMAISNDTAIVMVRDISQRKWVESERENLIQELEEKNAELERFTYTVSHDLKSPLITIKGFLGFVEQDATNGNLTRLKADIKRISDATEKMQSLLNELLELSRVGRLMNEFEYISFEELAHEAVELVQGRIQGSNVKVIIQHDLPTVYGDRKRLLEVVQNIVDNAAKFTGSQPNPRIEIGQEGQMEGKPIFFIKDNGIGIEPAHLDRIFGLFNKLNADSDGTGIGLTIVKRIVEVHNGRIWVTSEPGKGTTFFFTLQTGPAS